MRSLNFSKKKEIYNGFSLTIFLWYIKNIFLKKCNIIFKKWQNKSYRFWTFVGHKITKNLLLLSNLDNLNHSCPNSQNFSHKFHFGRLVLGTRHTHLSIFEYSHCELCLQKWMETHRVCLWYPYILLKRNELIIRYIFNSNEIKS